MNPTLTGKSPNGFGSGDLTGLKKIGRPAGCIKVPSAVTASDLS